MVIGHRSSNSTEEETLLSFFALSSLFFFSVILRPFSSLLLFLSFTRPLFLSLYFATCSFFTNIPFPFLWSPRSRIYLSFSYFLFCFILSFHLYLLLSLSLSYVRYYLLGYKKNPVYKMSVSSRKGEGVEMRRRKRTRQVRTSAGLLLSWPPLTAGEVKSVTGSRGLG